MHTEFEQTPFSLAALTGLLGGITAAVLNFMLFILFSSPELQISTPALFNPFTISFGSLFPPLLAGMIYAGLGQLKQGSLLYIICFGACFIWLLFLASRWNLFINRSIEGQFRAILITMLIVIGIFTLAIPWFVKNRNRLVKII